MEKQIALFKLCFENKLTFESYPKHDLIQVMEFDEDSEFLFRENLFHPTDFKIDELISKVEKHIESKKTRNGLMKNEPQKFCIIDFLKKVNESQIVELKSHKKVKQQNYKFN